MRNEICISGGPPSVESPKSPRGIVPKSDGWVWLIVVTSVFQLYHLNGLKKSSRSCALNRSLIGKSLYIEAFAPMIRCGIHMFTGMLPLVNEGATTTQPLPTFGIAVPQFVTRGFCADCA